MEPRDDQGRETLTNPPGVPTDPRASVAPGAPTDPGLIRPNTLFGWALPAALLAGLVAWQVGESFLDIFKLTPEEAASGVVSYTPTDNSAFLKGKRRVASSNVAFQSGVLAISLAVSLGLAGGLARRSIGGSFLGGSAGALVGGVAAIASSLALVPLFLTFYQHDHPNLFLPLLIHGGIWGSIGAAVGLAVGLGVGSGRLGKVALGGLAGAIVATVCYEVIYAIAFPFARSETPIASEREGRLIADMVVALAIAIGATWQACKRSRKREMCQERTAQGIL